jgi:hypothetical protein
MSWDWYSSRLGIPARDLLPIFAAEFDVALNIDRAMTIYANAFHENLTLIREITLVAELARAYREKLPMAVASNGSSDHVIASLVKVGFVTTVRCHCWKGSCSSWKTCSGSLPRSRKKIGCGSGTMRRI